jgi:hypothetical protein
MERRLSQGRWLGVDPIRSTKGTVTGAAILNWKKIEGGLQFL